MTPSFVLAVLKDAPSIFLDRSYFWQAKNNPDEYEVISSRWLGSYSAKSRELPNIQKETTASLGVACYLVLHEGTPAVKCNISDCDSYDGYPIRLRSEFLISLPKTLGITKSIADAINRHLEDLSKSMLYEEEEARLESIRRKHLESLHIKYGGASAS